MLRSIEIVEAVPNKENPDERRRRLRTVRLLEGIVGPLVRRLSARMVAVLTQEARREAKAETSVDTDGLIDAAISLVETDLQRAAELSWHCTLASRPTSHG